MPGVRCWSPRFLQAPVARGHGGVGRGHPESEAAARDLPVPGGVNGVNLPARGAPVNRQIRAALRALVRPSTTHGLLRVDALGVELLADEAQLLGGGRRASRRASSLIFGSQAIVARTSSSVAPGWSEVEAHLAGLVEVPDAEVGDDHRRPAAVPAAGAPDPLGLLGAAEVAGRGPEVDLLDERARRLAHDHEHVAGVDRDLARAARPRQPRLRGRVVADDRRVDVAEPVDLGRAQEARRRSGRAAGRRRTARTSRRRRWRR